MMLTPEERAAAEHRLRNPAPGSRIAAARDFGVDLTLLIERLRLTPEQRVIQMAQVLHFAQALPNAERW